MVSTIDEARTPAELAEWLRVWADGYEEGVDYLDDNDARQLAEAVERVCTNGNASALRDALVAFVDSIQWLCDGDERGLFKKQFAPLLSEARAALAAPARNCDLYATAEDAYAAWMVSPKLTPICEWLLAPAEGGAK